MKNFKSFNEQFNENNMVEVEIPMTIIEICKRHNISDENIKEVFLNYINYTLGIEYGTESNGFEAYCEESDNITDYIN